MPISFRKLEDEYTEKTSFESIVFRVHLSYFETKNGVRQDTHTTLLDKTAAEAKMIG